MAFHVFDYFYASFTDSCSFSCPKNTSKGLFFDFIFSHFILRGELNLKKKLIKFQVISIKMISSILSQINFQVQISNC